MYGTVQWHALRLSSITEMKRLAHPCQFSLFFHFQLFNFKINMTKKSQRLSPTSTFSPSLSVSMVTVSSSSGSSGSGGATPSTSEARCSRRSLNESYRDPFLGKKTSTKMMRCTITSYKIKIFPSTKIGFVGNFRCFFWGGLFFSEIF